jgi:hypothetical protein
MNQGNGDQPERISLLSIFNVSPLTISHLVSYISSNLVEATPPRTNEDRRNDAEIYLENMLRMMSPTCNQAIKDPDSDITEMFNIESRKELNRSMDQNLSIEERQVALTKSVIFDVIIDSIEKQIKKQKVSTAIDRTVKNEQEENPEESSDTDIDDFLRSMYLDEEDEENTEGYVSRLSI